MFINNFDFSFKYFFVVEWLVSKYKLLNSILELDFIFIVICIGWFMGIVLFFNSLFLIREVLKY